MSSYTHCAWLIVLELQRSITICPWLPLVALATIDLVGDNRKFELSVQKGLKTIIFKNNQYEPACGILSLLDISTISLDLLVLAGVIHFIHNYVDKGIVLWIYGDKGVYHD